MIKILFVCHGNICRSPMAEFVMKDLVQKAGCADEWKIASAAVSREEIGNPVHPGTRERLRREGISTAGKWAVQMTREDYERYDWLIGMDTSNPPESASRARPCWGGHTRGWSRPESG